MNTHLNANELKQQVSIVALLSRLGYEPVPKRGREPMYVSMLRDDDYTPSFSVNDELGVWYDHGMGKGGNIIDFGLAFWKELSFQEVLARINEISQLPAPAERSEPRIRKPTRVPHYKVGVTKTIGTHPAITEYLKKRGVFNAAKAFLKEVYYFVEDQQGIRKQFFAAGWQNEFGGWEVRNRFFKGCIGPKAITFIEGNPKRVAVFEGYLDFLSWKLDNTSADHSIIVLNSLSLLRAAIGKAKAFPDIDIYFDRDKPGVQHTRELIKALPYATDKSKVYEGFNDYNDKLKAALPANLHTAKPVNFLADLKVPFQC